MKFLQHALSRYVYNRSLFDILLKLKWPKNKNVMFNRPGASRRIERMKTESARRWSNKWTKTLYQDYLHCIANFCRALLIIFSKQFISSNTKRRKRMLNFVWNNLKFWWNETDDEILPVFPQNHWTLKFIFSRSRGKLFFGVISGIVNRAEWLWNSSKFFVVCYCSVF